MTEYTLQPAAGADFPAIRRLIHEGGINPTGLDWRRFLVAVTPAGEVIGCGQLKPHGEEVIELASIAVAPAFRNRGIASAIIADLLATAPRPLYLMCRSGLGPFYQKFQFQPLEIADMPAYFRRLARLAGLVELLAQSGQTLLVMKLQ